MAAHPPNGPANELRCIHPGPVFDDLDSNRNDQMDLDQNTQILRIAVDFGTTFSSVAYARSSAADAPVTSLNVECIAHYPGDLEASESNHPWDPRQDVPTELLYSLVTSRLESPSGGRVRNSMQMPIPGELDTTHEADTDDESDREQHHDIGDENDPNIDMSFLDYEPEPSPKGPLFAPDSRDEEASEALAWGFEVKRQLANQGGDSNTKIPATRFKLRLADVEKIHRDLSDHGRRRFEEDQRLSQAYIKRLKSLKRVRSCDDVVTHFLQKLLVHTKKYLTESGIWHPTVEVEFILSVPAEWPSRACRIMQTSMARAALFSGLGRVEDDCLQNLFIVSEPEAAAAFVMAERGNYILPGETIIVLDAGGGTVDAITYTVTNSSPLRLSAEAVQPRTELCGASYINERYRKFLMDKLKHETYLEVNGKTIKSIVDQKVILFESTTKRFWDLENRHCAISPIDIPYLRASRTDSQLQKNQIVIGKNEVKFFFGRSLAGAIAVLKYQLDMAEAQKHIVQKVILTGGFGQSPYLQSVTRRFLEGRRNLRGAAISLIVSRRASTAVARGAILRASNKQLGPSRISQCSYGFLQSEPYEPEVWPAHKFGAPRRDRVDGELYVHKTILWLFHKGELLEVGRKQSILVRHTFELAAEQLVCEEILLVSDDEKESHYRRSHAKNKGAEDAGSISVDMTFLKNEKLIKPELVADTSSFSKKRKKIWVVEFDLYVVVDGRNLVYEARWPAAHGSVSVEQKTRAKGQTCIAASFKPGTA